jgi:hypothetical protein
MLFDSLCDLCEAHLPDLVPLLQAATIIRMDIQAHKELDRQIPPDDVIDLRNSFQLPSPIVVVEDTGSCVLLADLDTNVEGLFRRRFVLDCIPMSDANLENYADGRDILRQVPGESYPPGTCAMSAGELHPSRHMIDAWNVGCRATLLFAGTKDWRLLGPFRGDEIPQQLHDELTHSLSRNAITAVEELISLRKGDWAITVELPTGLAQTHKVLRSWEREVVVPIKHELVDQLFGESQTRHENGKTVQLIRRMKGQN